MGLIVDLVSYLFVSGSDNNQLIKSSFNQVTNDSELERREPPFSFANYVT
jgi:hypothetical protein